MNCPNCGGVDAPAGWPGVPDLRLLQGEYFPEKNAGRGPRSWTTLRSFPCPVCAIPLVHAILGAHQIHYCTAAAAA